MDDWDEDLDGPRPEKEAPAASEGGADKAAGTNGSRELPYSGSFVLLFPQLDPNLLFPAHFAFLKP